MKLKKILNNIILREMKDSLNENAKITEPAIYNNYGYDIVVCSEAWLRNHTYDYRDTGGGMLKYFGYIKSEKVQIDVRSHHGLPYDYVILFHFEYENGLRGPSDRFSGPTDKRLFIRELKKLSKTSSKPVKIANQNPAANSKQKNPQVRNANHYYVFHQDISHGHNNEVSNPIEYESKQKAISRSNDDFSYDKYDKNGTKTWVEDSDGNVIFRPKDSGESSIFSTKR